MRQVTQIVDVYKFEELPEHAQNRIIEMEVDLIMDNYHSEFPFSENIQRAVKKAEELKTPWFTGAYIWDYAKDEILETINQHEYTIEGHIYWGSD